MILKDKIQEIVEESLKKAIVDKKFPEGDYPDVKIEYPKEEKFGDYATPLAMESAKILRRSPMEIGSVLKNYIIENSLIEKVEIAKPGFINMFISVGHLHNVLNNVVNEKINYGKAKAINKKNINIEFVSANPTGPLNIVSARAAALGDTIANILEFCGHKVVREFYINDYGNQVYLLGKSVLLRYKELIGEKIDFPEEGYHGEYVKDIARYINNNFESNVKLIDNEEELIEFMSKKAIDYNVDRQKEDLEKFNISYDNWFSERSLHEDGKVLEAYNILNKKKIVYEEEGKKFFKSTDFGDDKDRVILRDDGRPTYFLADISYHKDKVDRGYDMIIDIWGPDHHGYINRLSGAVSALGFNKDNFKVLIAQQVNLIMEGETVKMSKRLGKFSTMKELLDEIGKDVSRYFFVMRSMDSHLDFDLALAKKESTENPVYYLQYAHARICSIFREAEKRGIQYDPLKSELSYLNNKESIVLLKMLARFPEEIYDIALNFEPHRISNFLMKLAQTFHKFYTEHRVLTGDMDKTNSLLLLCQGVEIVMKNGLALLGVSAPERM